MVCDNLCEVLKFEKNKGFSSLIVLLAVVLATFVAFKSISESSLSPRVLSESDSGGSGGGDEQSEPSEPEDTAEPQETSEPEHEDEVETEAEVEQEGNTIKLKIKSSDGEFQFEQEGSHIQTQANFPVSVDAVTRELTITTPAGVKTVTVLPDQAVANLIANGFLSSQTNVEIETDEANEPVYQIEGVKFEKFLGLFNAGIEKTIKVSAKSGEILATNQSIFNRILDLLSF